ncbi:hypothetical protein [Nostoc sp.]
MNRSQVLPPAGGDRYIITRAIASGGASPKAFILRRKLFIENRF